MILLRRAFPAALCACLAVWMCATPAAAAGISCGDWNTRKFFECAGAADVARCLKAGAKVNARDKFGSTPLHLAARWSKSPAVVAALLKAVAQVNARTKTGVTPLHAAAWSESPPVVAALLKAGADPKAKDIIGSTPLRTASISLQANTAGRRPTRRSRCCVRSTVGPASISRVCAIRSTCGWRPGGASTGSGGGGYRARRRCCLAGAQG